MKSAIALASCCLACSDHGETPPVVFDAATSGDATLADAAAPDAGPTAEALCDDWCAALASACGAGDGDCAGDCRARLPELRPNCVSAFRAYFGCLLGAEGGFTCLGPGEARPLGCDELGPAWQLCAR